MTTTAKINKSTVLKQAWKMVRKFCLSLSKALQLAWKYAKEQNKLVHLDIRKESERGVAIVINFQYVWFAKSALVGTSVPKWIYQAKMKEKGFF